jgi:hypothetical protein
MILINVNDVVGWTEDYIVDIPEKLRKRLSLHSHMVLIPAAETRLKYIFGEKDPEKTPLSEIDPHDLAGMLNTKYASKSGFFDEPCHFTWDVTHSDSDGFKVIMKAKRTFFFKTSEELLMDYGPQFVKKCDLIQKGLKKNIVDDITVRAYDGSPDGFGSADETSELILKYNNDPVVEDDGCGDIRERYNNLSLEERQSRNSEIKSAFKDRHHNQGSIKKNDPRSWVMCFKCMRLLGQKESIKHNNVYHVMIRRYQCKSLQ